jgi:hypothetical protein
MECSISSIQETAAANISKCAGGIQGASERVGETSLALIAA